MSAMGPERTLSAQIPMSALPPKADIRRPAQSITLGQLGDELHVFLRRPNAASTGANIA